MDKIGRYEFLAEPFHCDSSQKLFMSHLGNHLINAADFHSNERGFGMHYLNSIGKTWVLSRLSVELSAMPRSYERFAVETWVESVMRYFTNRNFRIVSAEDGHVYGHGRSVWAMIDTATRQPTDLLSVGKGHMADWVETEKECPMARPQRVKVASEASHVRDIDVRYSDIDMNGHVNSIKYIEHILDLWDTEWHKAHPLRRIDIAYVAEAHVGDVLRMSRCDTDGQSASVLMMRADGGEVCRSLVSFS